MEWDIEGETYKELGWESLDSWFSFYKIVNKLTHAYMLVPIPPLQQAQYSFRKKKAIGQMRVKDTKI